MPKKLTACTPPGFVALLIGYRGLASLVPRLHALTPLGQGANLHPRLAGNGLVEYVLDRSGGLVVCLCCNLQDGV